MQKLFGTDGVRGIYGEDITPNLAYDIGRAIALYLKDKECNNILIAKDTRMSGDILLTSFISGSLAMGVNVTYMGKCTTPCLAFLTKNNNFGCGIMITASHNSYEYNGIKVFKHNGEKLGVKEEKILTKIYKNLDNFKLHPSAKCGKFDIKYNLINKYINYLKSLIKDKYYDMAVAFDCSNGISYKIVQKLFEDNFKRLFLINTSQNGKKVNENCGATDTKNLSEFVVENNLDMGFAFDGDADRIVMVNSEGILIDGDDILFNLALFFKQKNKLKKDTVVGTSMTNMGLEKALKKEGIKLIRVDVGDKYIVDRLVKDRLSLGGEKAGHIIHYEYTNTGDGVLTSLIMLDAVKNVGLQKVNNYPQKLVNITLSKIIKDKLIKDNLFVDFIKNMQTKYKDYRIVVRPSGTENKVRVMAEGQDESTVDIITNEVCDFILEKYL